MPSILNSLAGLSATHPHICLVMIVKDDPGADESHVLGRCLASCEGVVSSAALLSTSQHVIGVRGRCQRVTDSSGLRPVWNNAVWRGDFSAARNAALAMARRSFPEAEWFLLLDADEVLHVPDPGQLFQALRSVTADSCAIPMVVSEQIIPRVNLIRNIDGWAYVDAIHETITFQGGEPTSLLLGRLDDPTAGPHVTTPGDGARSRDPQKVDKDIAAMRAAYAQSKKLKFLYFLGITQMNAGRTDDAKATLGLFLSRATEETQFAMRFYATLSLGRLLTGKDAQRMLERAHALCPSRPEPLCELAIAAFNEQQWHMARLYALGALANPIPSELNYLEPRWLQWAAMDILCAALVNLGWYQQAVPALHDLLSRAALPMSERPRIQGHLDAITKQPS